MLNGVLVFDNVIHNYNNDPSNLLGRRGEIANRQIWGLVSLLTDDPPSYEDFAKAWTPQRVFEEVFGGGLTDFAIAQTVTLFGLWKMALPLSSASTIFTAHIRVESFSVGEWTPSTWA